MGGRTGDRADGRFLHADRRRPLRLRPDRGSQFGQRHLCDGRPAADRARHRGVPERRPRARHDPPDLPRRLRQAARSGRVAPWRPHGPRPRDQVRLRRHRRHRSGARAVERRRPRRATCCSSPSPSAPASSAPPSSSIASRRRRRRRRHVDADVEQGGRRGAAGPAGRGGPRLHGYHRFRAGRPRLGNGVGQRRHARPRGRAGARVRRNPPRWPGRTGRAA